MPIDDCQRFVKIPPAPTIFRAEIRFGSGRNPELFLFTMDDVFACIIIDCIGVTCRLKRSPHFLDGPVMCEKHMRGDGAYLCWRISVQQQFDCRFTLAWPLLGSLFLLTKIRKGCNPCVGFLTVGHDCVFVVCDIRPTSAFVHQCPTPPNSLEFESSVDVQDTCLVALNLTSCDAQIRQSADGGPMLFQRIDLNLFGFISKALLDMTEVHRDDEAGLLPCQSVCVRRLSVFSVHAAPSTC